MGFQLVSKYKPTGDQPEAIKELTTQVLNGEKYQVLLGVTGSGKTFTVANLIERVQKPTLVLSHNKTLAAQLYSDLKAYFPKNAVEYFISYYDYYQPEAYIPATNTYIEKDLSINQEIDKLRIRTTSSLLSERSDVIVVSSVSCLYGIGNPENFYQNSIQLKKGQTISREQLLRQFVDGMYMRNDLEFSHGCFRVKGDTVDIFPAYEDLAYRILFWGNEIEAIEKFHPHSNSQFNEIEAISIFPANIFITSKDTIHQAIGQIQDDLQSQVSFLNKTGKKEEAERLYDRVTFDIEMIKELGYCSGIENYSRYFDGRKKGTRPYCLLDYFPKDFMVIIDESHVTIPQVRAMYGGDSSRKNILVDYGFRLPAALDNRPLTLAEFEKLSPQTIYVSATPADYELDKTKGLFVEQIIRPTGLLDPKVIIKPSLNQIDNLIYEINSRVEKNERILITTLTKRMAEELHRYLSNIHIRCRYIHSDIDALKRVEIMEGLRSGDFDVLVGINLLREGLDLPEVSLVAILDADKEGFLRSTRSLIQTAGRAARHMDGTVIMYADKITKSIKETIDSTNYRREKQLNYNTKHNITPKTVIKEKRKIIAREKHAEKKLPDLPVFPIVDRMNKEQLEATIVATKERMLRSSKELDFIQAALYRDEMHRLQSMLKAKFDET